MKDGALDLEWLEPLAIGGTHEIHLARRRAASGALEHVVIKRLRSGSDGDVESALLLRDEGRLLARLRHPGVVALLGSGEDALGPYLVLEHVDGVDLRRLIIAARSAAVTARVLGRVLLDVTRTLAFLHDGPDPVIHRDLTPANVLVDASGAPRLIDFGMAHAGGRVYETGTGVIKGTIGYMAPEQFEGRPDAGGATDVFALGIAAHEAFAGRHPFLPADPLTLERRVRASEFARLRESTTLPEPLAELLDRTLAPEASARPHARDLLLALEAWAADVPREDVATLVARARPEASEIRTRS